MKVKEVNMILDNPKLQNHECNFKIVSKKKSPPEWFQEFEKRLNTRLDSIDHRIDNLVKLNNLKE